MCFYLLFELGYRRIRFWETLVIRYFRETLVIRYFRETLVIIYFRETVVIIYFRETVVIRRFREGVKANIVTELYFILVGFAIRTFSSYITALGTIVLFNYLRCLLLFPTIIPHCNLIRKCLIFTETYNWNHSFCVLILLS